MNNEMSTEKRDFAVYNELGVRSEMRLMLVLGSEYVGGAQYSKAAAARIGEIGRQQAAALLWDDGKVPAIDAKWRSRNNR